MPDSPMNIALVQMTSSLNVADNAAHIANAISEASSAGAQVVSTPEMTNFLSKSKAQAFDRAMPEDQDQVLQAAIESALDNKVWVHLGSLCIYLSDTQLANRSFVINPQGQITARYDKLHMFDVDLGEGETYKESALFRKGEHAVLSHVNGAALGLSICYDLRFGSVYRTLAKAGAQVLTVPAAFTQPTGEAHWEALLRARAIETGCYVLAAGQTGTHACGRKTHGHSMVVDPWGSVVDRLEREPGILYASLDLTRVAEARRKVPALEHGRTFKLQKDGA